MTLAAALSSLAFLISSWYSPSATATSASFSLPIVGHMVSGRNFKTTFQISDVKPRPIDTPHCNAVSPSTWTLMAKPPTSTIAI